MKKHNLNDMTRGWFIGNFEPSIFNANFEVGIKKYKAGDVEKKHFHRESKEFTVVISGIIKMNGYLYKPDEIVQIDENFAADFECVEDAVIVVVKNKSIKGDKYLI